jgi:hypothetical protein
VLNKKPTNNSRKFNAFLLILLIAGFLVPIATVTASNQNSYGQNSQDLTSQGNQTENNTTQGITENSNQSSNAQPDQTPLFNAPEYSNAKQYNKSNITPKGEMEQIRAQEQTLFQYRNMTMLMNCTHNCSVTFTADDDITPKSFALSIDPNQTMALAMNLSKSPLNGAMVNERCLNFYLGIEPNATLELQAQIRLYINQTELSQSVNREVNTSKLTWMYWNQTRAQWETVQSVIDQNGYLACNTNHFSTWTVAEMQTEETIKPLVQESTIPLEYALAVGVAIVVVLALGIVTYKMRK